MLTRAKSLFTNYAMWRWLAILLILGVGLVHLVEAPSEYEEANYLGQLFVLNFLGSLLAAPAIYRNRWWGWLLGLAVSAGSIVAYAISRTVGMPGHGLESWWVPAGVLSLALEGAFTILMLFVWPQALKAAAVYSRAARALATAAQPAPSTRQRLITYFAPVSMILVLLLTGLVGAIWLSTVEVITQETLEQEYGIRVTMIATTMQDSAVDVRFEVLDQVKAQRLLENHDAHLYLRVGDNRDLIFSAGEGHHHGALREGINYYMFFPNPDHQIQPGTPVSFGFGNVQVEPIASR